MIDILEHIVIQMTQQETPRSWVLVNLQPVILELSHIAEGWREDGRVHLLEHRKTVVNYTFFVFFVHERKETTRYY